MPEEKKITAEAERSIALGDQATDNQIYSGDNRSITIEKDAISTAIISGSGNRVVIYQYQLERQVAEEKTAHPGEIGANPYKGLLAFHEQDGDRYFGREEQIEKLWNLFRTLHENITQPEPPLRLLPILGPSGCGKSSLARAGLIPELAQRPLPGKSQARVAVLVPGTHPVEALATVLARVATNDQTPVAKTKEFEQVLKETSNINADTIIYDGLRRIANVLPEIAESPLVVLVDQFEEVYSLCEDTTEHQIFIENLIHAAGDRAGRVSVIITLRSDFLGETQRHPALNQVIASQGAIVPAMSEEELQQAITKPAEIAGHPLHEAVVTLLLKDTQGREGALPLLQFALTRIWEGLKKGAEPIETLEKIGGVGGALADEAQRIYQSLNDEEKQIARRVFLGLVQLGEGTSDTRRRARINSLVSYKEQPEYVRRVINRFAHPGVRLVTLSSEQGTETAEVTHEALFANWRQMKEWLDSSRDDIRFQRRLDEAARLWDDNGCREGNLWRPPDLDLLRKYYQHNSDNMTPLQVKFFQASKRAANIRKLAQLLGLAVVLGLASVAVIGWRNAAISDIKSLAGSSDGFLNLDGGKALKSSIEAAVKMQGLWGVDANIRTQVELALLNTVHNVAAPNTLGGHGNSVNGVSFSPDGKMLASASDDKTVKLWDTSTGKEIKTLKKHTNWVWGVSFSPDGKMLATASADRTVKLWDTETKKEIKTLTGHTREVHRVSFSPDGKILASASADNRVILWNTSTGKEIKTLTGHTSEVWGIGFSPDGKMLASASADTTVKLWDTSTGTVIKTLKHEAWVRGVSFSPDGKMLASASDDEDETVKLWDTSTGTVIKTLTGHEDRVLGVSFSPDGKILASASVDQKVKLWDTSTKKEIKTLTGHTKEVWGVSFSPDSKMLASASVDNTVKLWDTSTGKEEIKIRTGHRGAVSEVSFSPDGKMLASASGDKTVKLWDTDTGKVIKTLTGHKDAVWAVSFAPSPRSANSSDGKILASASNDKTVKLWDTDTGKVIKKLTGHEEGVWGVSFSPDGKMLASASADRTVKLWDTDTGTVIKTLTEHKDVVNGVSFSPDGKMLASASDDNTVKLWDTETKKEIKTLTGHTSEVHGVSFSPDGKILASASADNKVKLWDTETKKEIKTLTGHTNTVWGVSFAPSARSVNSPDGKMLASASDDNTVKLWRWDFDYLLKEGCNFMREYFEINKPENESDKHLCDGVSNLNSG